MITAAPEFKPAFAVWLTGLSGSGKSTVTKELARLLRIESIEPVVLESDALRKVFSDAPTYDEAGRQYFYTAVAFMASTFVSRGIPVIVDATANRRAYRDRARQTIERFFEVYIECPIEVCIARDPKGLYREALANPRNQLPGLGAVYEPPERPEVLIHGDVDPPDTAAKRIIDRLKASGLIAVTEERK